jgi:hypothetical protein
VPGNETGGGAVKKCETCDGEGSFVDTSACGDWECCGPGTIECGACDGEGEIPVEEVADTV